MIGSMVDEKKVRQPGMIGSIARWSCKGASDTFSVNAYAATTVSIKYYSPDEIETNNHLPHDHSFNKGEILER
jgi:hypothetical protein